VSGALDEDVKKLGGIVEVDETHIGGDDKNRHWEKKSGSRGRGDTGKTPVVGAVRRKGNVVARVVEKADRLTLEAFVRETVSNRVSLLCTELSPAMCDRSIASPTNPPITPFASMSLAQSIQYD
jgi:hypothetical protein